jgi:two-component system heavy metal sensor histidine kinase CusS
MDLSIRWRLTLWNALALGAVLLGFAALVYALLRHALYERVDQGLRTDFRELAEEQAAAGNYDGRLRHWIDELKEHENFCCVVYGPGGEVLARTQELAAASVPPAPAGAADVPRLYDTTVPALGSQRAVDGRLRRGGREVTALILAPLEDVDRELGQLLAVLLLAVPVALALSGGVGYLLARKALSSVDRLRRSTEEITADRLDHRLPVANPRDELGRLTQTLNAMIARLERSFAEVRRFTADASHELRTPLTAIRTEAEVALAGPLPAAEYHQLLCSILEECDRLARLTDQLLTLAREDAAAARPVREPVDLAALVQGVAETMRPLAESRGLRLDVKAGGPLAVPGDAPRLRQVLYNVLDNAIKYTPEGRVTVRLARRDHAVAITVQDTGIGIRAEHLPRVFDRFYRVDRARSREQGGTGLGLSIAQSIVVAHGAPSN